jgi:hypothetical protein
MDKRKRGKRSGLSTRLATEREIHVYVRGTKNHKSAKSNFTATVIDNAIYYDCVDALCETPETHIVPRYSLTRKQLLGIFPSTIETEPVVSKQLDHTTGKMIEVTDNRIVYKSTRSLLNRTPSDQIGTFKREGSIGVGLNTRKMIRSEREVLTSEDDRVLGLAVDGVDFTPRRVVIPDTPERK